MDILHPPLFKSRHPRPRDQQHWLHVKSIVGHYAMWAIRQSPYGYPEGLEEVLTHLRSHFAILADREGMLLLSQSQVEPALRLFNNGNATVRDSWNAPKAGGDAPFVFVSRYGGPDPDHDIIDIDALARNVAASLFHELRVDAEFDHGFEWRWRLGAPLRWINMRLHPTRRVADPEGA